MISILRVLLALSVFFTHVYSGSWISGVGGDTAVELFFVISGYYISTILSKSYKESYKFYINRMLRIFPVYFLVLLLTVTTNPNQYLQNFNSITGFGQVTSLITNLTLIGLDQMYFLNAYNSAFFGELMGTTNPGNTLVIVPVAWTLSLELYFYLLAPKLHKLRTSTILLLATLGLASKLVFTTIVSSSDPWSYRFFPFELPFFLIGMLIARIKKEKFVTNEKSGIYTTAWILTCIGWYFMSVRLASHLVFSREIVIFSGIAIIAAASFLPTNNQTLRKIGEYSYPLYLCHYLIAIESIRFIHALEVPTSYSWIIVLCMTITVSYLLLFVTKPLEVIRTRIRGMAEKP